MTALPFLFLAGTICLLIQTASVGFLMPVQYKPDLFMILVVWASLRMTIGTGMAFAFVAGLTVDLLSGAPTGLFALIYCISFVACDTVNATFAVDRPAGRAVTVFAATGLSGAAVLLARWLAGPVEADMHTLLWIVAKSIVTGLTSVAVFPILDRSWTGYTHLVGAR